MQKHREHANFNLAYQTGQFKMFEERWNKTYFHTLGLHVRIEPPGVGEMDGMDVASSKLFRYQQKKGTVSPAPGVASKQGDKKEYRYQFKEGRHRMKAARKGRIIVLPFRAKDAPGSKTSTPKPTGSDGNHAQKNGVTAIVGTAAQDFADLKPKQRDAEGLHSPRATAQRPALLDQ